MTQSNAAPLADAASRPISVLSAGAIGLETGGAPLRLIFQILIFSAAAVLLVHLFLRTSLSLGELSAHAIVLSLIFTLGFVAAYSAIGALWPKTRSLNLPKSAFIWTVCIAAVGFGIAISQGLSAISAVLGESLSAHAESNLIPRLIPVWAIIVILLIQNEKRRLLLLELHKIPALKSRVSHTHDKAETEALSDVIKLQSGRAQFSLQPEQIAYVVAEGNYCSIHFVNAGDRNPLMVRTTFSHLIDQLPPELFAQIHRSHIVNMRCVKSANISATAGVVVLSNGQQLPVSRARLGEAMVKFADKLAPREMQ